MLKWIIGIVVATIAFIIVMAGVDNLTNNIDVFDDESTSLREDEAVQVTVTGEVNRTGTYLLENGSTLADLLEAAGKVTGNADARAYNTSIVLEDNQSYYIAPLYDQSDICAIEPITKVSINDGNKEELLTIDVFSDAVATSIVEYRLANGNYERLEDLYNVPGIGPATFEKCKNFVILHS